MPLFFLFFLYTGEITALQSGRAVHQRVTEPAHPLAMGRTTGSLGRSAGGWGAVTPMSPRMAVGRNRVSPKTLRALTLG